MSFLHPGRLWFGLFALLPLAFHLYQRLSLRRRVLPTLRFLARRSVSEERFRRLRRYLLLACRTLFLLLAALAWARPVTREEIRQIAADKAHLVICLDRSLSMQAVVAGQSRFSAAVTEARGLVERAPAGSVFTLIAYDSAPATICESEADPARVLDALRGLRPTLAGTRLAAALQAARTALLATGGAGRLAVLGDLQIDGSEAHLPGLLRGVSARLVFAERLLSPTPANRGVGAIALEIAGEPRLTVAAAGEGETARLASGRAWRLSLPRTGWSREIAAPTAAFLLPPSASETETLVMRVQLTGADALAADDSCLVTARLARPLPVHLTCGPAARPYLASALAALGAIVTNNAFGNIVIGDRSAVAYAAGARGLIIFSGEPPAPAVSGGAWALREAGPLAVPGLSRGRFSSRAALTVDSGTQPLCFFADNAPAAVEERLPNGGSSIRFGFEADRAASDFVLTAAFPLLIRAALQRLGAGTTGEIVSREPSAPPEESDLRSRSAEELTALLAPEAAPVIRGRNAGGEPPPDHVAPLLLSGLLLLLLAESLLGRIGGTR